jgi:hypothetical protein
MKNIKSYSFQPKNMCKLSVKHIKYPKITRN